MAMLFSATLGELTKLSISFLIDKYLQHATPSKEERLQQMLLRVRITVEEAEGRRITNQAMLRQLNMLKEGLYRGRYVLDTFRSRAHEEEDGNDHKVSRLLSLSKFNPAKRVCFSSSSRHGMKMLEDVLDSMEMIITDMNEFVVYVTTCPPMHRQPYSMYMFLEKCMFGRQMEMEMVINFLLQREPPGKGNLGALPIVGPSKAGKSTLVEHVCCDQRVRNHFSQIVLFNGNEFGEELLCTLRDGGIIKHQCSSLGEERLLVVIELDGYVDEGAWRRLHSASQKCFSAGSKIIITGRSDMVGNFGTTQALSLNFLSREAHWYFFKVLVFGSSDPEDQPKLASMAMEIFEEYFDNKMFWECTGPFIDANNIAFFLRANFDMQHWRRVLLCVKATRQRNPLQFSTVPSDNRVENKHFYIQRLHKLNQGCVVDSHVRIGLANEEIPKITIDEVIFGSVTPQGRFEVVVWKSHLPPYYSYITSCEIRESTFVLTRNKHCKKRKDLC